MPDRAFIGTHEIPTIPDRILAHPGIVVATWATMLAGVALGIDGALPKSVVGTYLGDIPDYAKLIGGIVLALGGAMSWVGLIWRPTRFDLSWTLERSGWFITGVTSLALVAAVLFAEPKSAIWLLPLQWAITALLRYIALHFIEKNQRDISARVKAERIIK